jgi:hypothetical protein
LLLVFYHGEAEVESSLICFRGGMTQSFIKNMQQFEFVYGKHRGGDELIVKSFEHGSQNVTPRT